MRRLAALGSVDVFVLGVTVVQTLVIARVLGPSDYGVLALATGFAAVVFMIMDLRTAELVPKFVGDAQAQARPEVVRAVVKLAIVLDLVVASAGTLVVIALAGWAQANFMHGHGSRLVLVLAAGTAALAAPSAAARALLTTLGAIRRIAAVAMAVAGSRVALTLLIVVVRPDVTRVLMWLLGIAVLESALYAAVALRYVRAVAGGGLRGVSIRSLRASRRDITRFVLYTSTSSLVGGVVKYLDVLVLGWFRGPVEAGYYRLAKSLTNAAAVPISSAQSLLYPRLVKLHATGGAGDVLPVSRRWNVRIGVPAAMAFVLTLPLVPSAIDMVAGRAYRPASAAAALLLVGLACSSALLALRPTFYAIGALRSFLLLTTTTSALSIVGFVAFAGAGGATAVAAVRLAVVGVLGNAMGALLLSAWRRRRRVRGDSAGQARLPATAI